MTKAAKLYTNGRSQAVRLKLQKLTIERIYISIVTYAELIYGVKRSNHLLVKFLAFPSRSGLN